MTFKFSENGSELLRLEAVTLETGTSEWNEKLKELRSSPVVQDKGNTDWMHRHAEGVFQHGEAGSNINC